MKIEKIQWASHLKNESIYSVDTHKSDKKFIICQNNTVFILKNSNSETIKFKGRELDDKNMKVSLIETNSKKQLLFKLAQHSLPINCVRFSRDGKYFATCSDDKCIVLCEYKGLNDTVGNFNKNVENWEAVHIFRNTHSSDVLMIDWSYDSKYLASCSVDNTIGIYDVQKRKSIKTLKGHNSIVKGLAFDPIGKYLLSQGEENYIIWDCTSWEAIKIINANFTKTMYNRLSWSPDGKYFVGTCGLKTENNKKKNFAPLFARNEFKHVLDITFGRYGSPFIVSKFNPCIFLKNNENETYIAFGCQDNSIVVLSSNTKPLMTTKNLFTSPITDITWSNCGYKLIVSSADGNLCFIEFTKEELGLRLSSDELTKELKNKYGEFGSSFTLQENSSVNNLIKLNQNFVSSDDNTSEDEKTEIEELPSSPDSSDDEMFEKHKRKIIPSKIQFHLNDDVESENEDVDFRINSDEESENEEFEHEEILNDQIIEIVNDKKRKRMQVEKEKSIINRPSLKRERGNKLNVKIDENNEIKSTIEGLIEFYNNNKEIWAVNLYESIVNTAANTNFVAIAGELNSLNLFSFKSGTRLLPKIILDSKIEFLYCNKEFDLIVLTQEKKIYVYNLKLLKCTLTCRADYLVTKFKDETITIDDVGITENSIPIVTISNGESYAFNINLNSWLVIADGFSPLSQFTSSSDIYLNENLEYYNIRRLKSLSSKYKISNGSLIQQNEQNNEDLETGIYVTELLQDQKEYKRYVIAYTNQLIENNKIEKLKELLNSLFGNYDNYKPSVKNLSKRILLNELTHIKNVNPTIQRILNEYRSLLLETLK